jgi:surface antigen
MSNISLSSMRAKWLIAVALIMLLPGCQTADTRRTGGLIGSIAGSIGASYLGSYLGGGTVGRILGAVAGGVAGYYVGAEIGGVLGKDDRKKMADASQRAFETNQTQTFSNPDSGLVGKAEVVLSGPVAAEKNKECKTIRQTVVLKDGKTVTEDVNSCKD